MEPLIWKSLSPVDCKFFKGRGHTLCLNLDCLLLQCLHTTGAQKICVEWMTSKLLNMFWFSFLARNTRPWSVLAYSSCYIHCYPKAFRSLFQAYASSGFPESPGWVLSLVQLTEGTDLTDTPGLTANFLKVDWAYFPNACKVSFCYGMSH